jgi:hypothetical protein
MTTLRPSAEAGAGVPFLRTQVILEVGVRELSHVARHTSHVTRHTSHVTRHLPSTQRPTESPPPGGGVNLICTEA